MAFGKDSSEMTSGLCNNILNDSVHDMDTLRRINQKLNTELQMALASKKCLQQLCDQHYDKYLTESRVNNNAQKQIPKRIAVEQIRQTKLLELENEIQKLKSENLILENKYKSLAELLEHSQNKVKELLEKQQFKIPIAQRPFEFEISDEEDFSSTPEPNSIDLTNRNRNDINLDLSNKASPRRLELEVPESELDVTLVKDLRDESYDADGSSVSALLTSHITTIASPSSDNTYSFNSWVPPEISNTFLLVRLGKRPIHTVGRVTRSQLNQQKQQQGEKDLPISSWTYFVAKVIAQKQAYYKVSFFRMYCFENNQPIFIPFETQVEYQVHVNEIVVQLPPPKFQKPGGRGVACSFEFSFNNLEIA